MTIRFEVEVDDAVLVGDRHEVGSHYGTGIDKDTPSSPMLLLHPGVADRRCWERVIPTWSTTRTVVTYDRRGFGEATWTEAAHDSVADLLTVMDEQELSRAILVGNSFGGGIALQAALDHPDRVSALLLIAPYVPGAPWPDLSDHVAVPPAAVALDEACDAAAARGDVTEAVRLNTKLWLDGWATENPRVDESARTLFQAMCRRSIEARPVGEDQGITEVVWSQLEQIQAPTLVVTGGHDLPYMNVRAVETAERMPNGQHTHLEDAAHLPQLGGHFRLLTACAAFLANVA